jgi:hypothetical protein
MKINVPWLRYLSFNAHLILFMYTYIIQYVKPAYTEPITIRRTKSKMLDEAIMP